MLVDKESRLVKWICSGRCRVIVKNDKWGKQWRIQHRASGGSGELQPQTVGPFDIRIISYQHIKRFAGFTGCEAEYARSDCEVALFSRSKIRANKVANADCRR